MATDARPSAEDEADESFEDEAESFEDEALESRSGRGLRVTLIAVLVAALALIVGTGGWLLGHRAGSPDYPKASSVDAGFARDMSIHHQQAITMATYERAYTTNPDLKLLAYDIEDEQSFQKGEMQGWLEIWSLSLQSNIPQMSWMGITLAPGELMHGLATPAQLTRFETLRGTAMDKLFLQLMIRHHQGGVQMATYAMHHAKEVYVRNLAAAMVSAQSAEIVQMEQTLRQLGGEPLPPAA